MAKLLDTDIRTREVTSWPGIHVFHDPGSSCSQKLRIFLNLKGIAWESHPIDVLGKANLSDYYLGINPRGLVPTLVDEGEVHIESNDIILYLERKIPQPRLVPVEYASSIAELLHLEDDLHLDLRTVSFAFMLQPDKPPKSAEDLAQYAARGSGTVNGQADGGKQREIAFWRQFLSGGISAAQACASVSRFAGEFARLDRDLSNREYLLGETLSVLDIAWAIYVNRLVNCGYPLARHPNLDRWARMLLARPEFARELSVPPEIARNLRQKQDAARAEGRSLVQLCGL